MFQGSQALGAALQTTATRTASSNSPTTKNLDASERQMSIRAFRVLCRCFLRSSRSSCVPVLCTPCQGSPVLTANTR